VFSWKNISLLSAVAGALAFGTVVTPASADSVEWTPFVIRNSSTGNIAPTIVKDADGNGVTATIALEGQKAGYGTAAYDGVKVSALKNVTYTRRDSGNKEVYVNIWVTDGTNYAVITPRTVQANTGGYVTSEVNGMDLQTLGFGVYETDTSSLNWLFNGAQRMANGSLLKGNGSVVTLADIGHLTIDDPGTYTTPPVGTGAPTADLGFNLIFGDTENHHTQGLVPFSVDNVQVALVPLPAAAWAGMMLLGGLGLRRARRA
jgi:hypothetical protein